MPTMIAQSNATDKVSTIAFVAGVVKETVLGCIRIFLVLSRVVFGNFDSNILRETKLAVVLSVARRRFHGGGCR
jgi:hypothetical protein